MKFFTDIHADSLETKVKFIGPCAFTLPSNGTDHRTGKLPLVRTEYFECNAHRDVQ